jgi:hypothetical protein
MNPIGLFALTTLPVSSACCEICMYSPCASVTDIGCPAEPAGTPPPAVTAATGVIVTVVSFCDATMLSDGLPISYGDTLTAT